MGYGIIIAFDISSKYVGMAFKTERKIYISSFHSAKDNPRARISEMTDKIVNTISYLLDKHNADKVLVLSEALNTFLNKDSVTAILHAQGVIEHYMFNMFTHDILRVPVTQARKALLGNGKASKQEVLDWCRENISPNIRNDHESDALAVLSTEVKNWPKKVEVI